MAPNGRTGRGRHTTLASLLVAVAVLAGLYAMHVATDLGGCHGAPTSVATHSMVGDAHHDGPDVQLTSRDKAGSMCIPTLPRTFDWAPSLIAVSVVALAVAWIAFRPVPAARPARPPPRDLLVDLCISRT
jgi:hypothetical protein